MAEIYKQQIQHKVGDRPKLKGDPIQRYIETGLQGLGKGFAAVDEYTQKVDDQRLAGTMDAVAQDAAATIKEWKDFNTEGRQELFSKLIERWNEGMSSGSYEAQRRFEMFNPGARNIYEIKVNEAILEKARDQVFNEKQRAINGFVQSAMGIRDMKQQADFFTEVLNDQLLSDSDDLMTVEQKSKLADEAMRSFGKGTILQAIIDGNIEGAKKRLNSKFYTSRLGPEEMASLQKSVAELEKSKKEDEAAGGNYKEVAEWLVAMRNGMQARFGDTTENRVAVDQTLGGLAFALANGKSFDEIQIGGVPLYDAIREAGGDPEVLKKFSELPLTTRQLAVNSFEKTMKEAMYPEYATQQAGLASSFLQKVDQFKDSEGNIDLRKIDSQSFVDLKRMVGDLSAVTWGLDNDVLKQLVRTEALIREKEARASKAISVETFDNLTERRGVDEWFNGATYIGTGNIPLAQVTEMITNPDKPSIVDEIAEKSTRAEFKTFVGEDNIFASGDKKEKKQKEPGHGYNSSLKFAVDNMVAPVMQELGEVDDDGDFEMPKSNSYRYMTYAIPVIFSAIAVGGNEKDKESLGFSPNLTGMNTVHLIEATQQYYESRMDDVVDTANYLWGSNVENVKNPGEKKPNAYNIHDSSIYDMVMTVHGIAYDLGFTNMQTPDEQTIAKIATSLRNIVPGDSGIQSLGRMFDRSVSMPKKDSNVTKRIDEKTPRNQKWKITQ